MSTSYAPGRRLALGALAAAVLLATACRADHAGDIDAGPTVDAPDGIGCTPTSPRTQPPETFIGPTGVEARMAALIDGAQHTLDIQMYLFTVQALAHKRVAAKERGVQVRLLLDPDHDG